MRWADMQTTLPEGIFFGGGNKQHVSEENKDNIVQLHLLLKWVRATALHQLLWLFCSLTKMNAWDVVPTPQSCLARKFLVIWLVRKWVWVPSYIFWLTLQFPTLFLFDYSEHMILLCPWCLLDTHRMNEWIYSWIL